MSTQQSLAISHNKTITLIILGHGYLGKAKYAHTCLYQLPRKHVVISFSYIHLLVLVKRAITLSYYRNIKSQMTRYSVGWYCRLLMLHHTRHLLQHYHCNVTHKAKFEFHQQHHMTHPHGGYGASTKDPQPRDIQTALLWCLTHWPLGDLTEILDKLFSM